MISNLLLFQLFHFVFVFINGELIPSPFVKLNKPPFSNKLPVSIKHPPSPPPHGIEINKLPGGRGVLNRGFRVSRNHRNRHYNRIEETVSVFCIRPKVHVNLGEQQLPTIMPIALMHVYVTQANFTTKPRFEIKNKRSFTEMNSQGSRVEKNTHAQKVQMQKILFTNEACW